MAQTLVPWLDEQQHVALARVAVRVTQLEWNLLVLVAEVLRTDPKKAEATVEGLQNDKLIREARKQLAETFPKKEDVSNIDRMFGKIWAVREKRHEFMHSIWGYPLED